MKNYPIDDTNYIEGNICLKMQDLIKTNMSPLGKWIIKNAKSIIMSAIFLEIINQVSHIDISPSYNFYTVLEGEKEVVIVPAGYENYLNMENGIIIFM